MWFGGKKTLGLDIGSSSLKMAELELKRGRATLVGFGFLPTPQQCFHNGEVSDVGQLGLAVSQLHAEMRAKNKQINLGLSGNSVIVKRVTIPKVDNKILEEQVRWEAEQYVPFDLQQASFEHSPIAGSDKGDSQDVLVVAARNEMVEQYCSVVTGAGLEVSVVDVSGLAIGNCLEFNYPEAQGTSVVFDLGATSTTAVVVDTGTTVFVREIPVAAATLTAEIQSEMEVTQEEAESLKVGLSLGQPVPEEVQRAISTGLENLLTELKATVDFFASSSGGIVQRAFLTGGGTLLPKMVESVGTRLGLPSEVINPFRRVECPGKHFSADFLRQIQPYATIAVGLALHKGGS